MGDYSVYVHTNKENGKKYVGVTSLDVKERWRNGNGYRENEYFHRAITKYGWDSFIHDVIYEGLSKKDAGQYERQLIREYNSDNPASGYNLMYGRLINGRHSTASIKKMSESMKGKYTGPNHPLWGTTVSEETKEKIRMAQKGENSPFWRVPRTEEVKKKISLAHMGKSYSAKTKRKMSEAKKGKYDGGKNPAASPTININTGKVFDCIKEAATFFGIHVTNISGCCRGERKYAGRHPDTGEEMLWMYYEDYIKNQN